MPLIGVAKRVTSVTNNGDGSYLVEYRLVVRNYGDVPLSMVQVADNLAATFAGATSFSGATATSTDFAVNAGYSGSMPDTDLLLGTDTLGVGQEGEIIVTVAVTPGANLGPYDNSATATGKSPQNAMATDTSQSGVNPDPDNNGDPTDNNAPTPLTLAENPRIGLAKAVSSVANNGNGTFTVVYSLVVRNYGDIKLGMVQVVDNLAATFAGATSFGSVSASSGDFTVNPGYTGSAPNTSVLAGTDMLAVGAQGTIQISVTVTPNGSLGPFDNSATATGKSPAGTTATDMSQDGVNPDPDNNGNPADNSDPTPVSFTELPGIGVAKAVSALTDNGNGSYTVVYSLVVRNYGDVTLSMVQVTDDLAATFAGAMGFSMVSASSGDFAVDPGYTGSAPNTDLLAGTDMLGVGAQGTIQISVTVAPNGNLGPYDNTATASGKSPAGTTVTDDSQDGVDPDPDNDGDPTDDDDPTPVTISEDPRIGVAKAVGSVTNNGNGSYTVVYSLIVRNYGNVKLSQIQVVDNLAATFAGATSFGMVSVSSGDFTVNPGYSGSAPNTDLLSGTDMLAVGGQGAIEISVTVTPNGSLGPFDNTAVATGRSPATTIVTDGSQNGVNPDPDGDGDPTDNGDPTPVSFTENPRIGVSKQVDNVTNNGDGSYTVGYSLLVRNYGDVKLNMVQVNDDLATAFAGATGFAVVGVTSADLTVNGAFTGSVPNTELLSGTDMLNVGAQGTIQMSVTVTPGGDLGPYDNVAAASGTSPAGTTVVDASQDGTNPDPDNNGNPTDNNDPTPVSFTEEPRVGLAKDLASVTNNGNGTFTVVYDLVVRNYGNVKLSQVQVVDNLAATFAGATGFNMVGASSVAFSINAGYDGDGDTNLLVGTDTLNIGASGAIQVTVTVTPGANLGPYDNTAVAMGISPAGANVADTSQDGLDPDPDNDDNPADNSDSTPVTFAESPAIGVAKSVNSVTNHGDGTYTVLYTLLVRNYGNVKLSMVQVSDDMAATFAGATSFMVLGVVSGDFTVDPGFSGSAPNTDLLAGTDSLLVGGQGTIQVAVQVAPNGNLGPFDNLASAAGTSPAGMTVTDDSQDGINPDPDDNQDPTDDNDPTPVSFTESPRIGVAKALASVTNNGNGTYTVVYDILVRNYGNVQLGLVRLVDDLDMTFAGATGFGMVSLSSGDFTVNPGYTGSVPNTNLLAGSDVLAIGAQGSIQVTVTVTPGANLGPFDNSSIATGTSPAGTTVADLSQDGVDADPDDDADPTDNNEPTPLTFDESPAIGLSKVVGSVTNNGDGTYTVVYGLIVRNYGNVPLGLVQVSDNLATTFAGATSVTVLGVVSGDFATNGGYTGSPPNTGLLAGTDSLTVGGQGAIQVAVRVRPNGNLGPFTNTATAAGTSPAGTTMMDASQDGISPDPDNDRDPTDNNDPTPVSFTEDPGIGTAKAVSSVVNNGNGTYTVAYDIVVRNYGNVPLGLVHLADDLGVTFAGAVGFGMVSLSSGDFSVNPSYTGSAPNTNLLVGNDVLNPGAQGAVHVVVTVTPGVNLGPFDNTAIATGRSPAGTTVADSSQEGLNPDPDKDGNPANDDDPTPVSFTEVARIGVAKAVGSVTPLPGGGFTVIYNLVVRNYGNVKLSGVQVTDDLAATFAGANSFSQVSATSGDFTVNPGYTGTLPNTGLLAGTDMLDAGAQGTIRITLRVVPGGDRGPYDNTAVASGLSPAGTTVMDSSQDGISPDPDGDGDPANNGVPTSITFAEPSGVVLAALGVQPRPGGGATVVWETSAEADVAGFNVYRAAARDGAYLRINPALIPASGSASAGEHYRFADAGGTVDHFYKLEVVTSTGAPQTYGPVSMSAPWSSRNQRIHLPALLRHAAIRPSAASQAGPGRRLSAGSRRAAYRLNIPAQR